MIWFEKNSSLSDRNRAYNKYQIAKKAVDELTSSTEENRRKHATQEEKERLKKEEAYKRKCYEEYKRVNEYYDVCLRKGYPMKDAERKWDEVLKKYNAQCDVVADLKARIGAKESLKALNEITALDDEIIELNSLLSKGRQDFQPIVKSKILPAFWILLGVLMVPVLIKLFLYYLVAPLAQKCKEVSFEVGSRKDKEIDFHDSGVSLDIQLSSKEELLVKPGYLQATPQACKKSTKLLLNNKLPFTSFLSKMCLLTRLSSDKTSKIVVSAQDDPISEVRVVDLPAGSAMVIQPRSLVGAVQKKGEGIKVTRHWRIFSLHSWLTLQLRYLIFHGECKLILKGGRGVKIEKAEIDNSVLVNQTATIGFSTNLKYKSSRCETFIPYLRGKEALFNDSLRGDAGIYVYEQVPVERLKGGITGRGVEGMCDVVLKLFGI